MNSLREADAWAARRLFFPLIFRVCRLTRISQYEFAGYAAVLSLLCFVPLLLGGRVWPIPTGTLVLLGIVGIMIANHGLRPEVLRRPIAFWRAYIWLMIALNVIGYFTESFRPYGLLLWVFQQFAQYALLIDTLPPAPGAERRSRRDEKESA